MVSGKPVLIRRFQFVEFDKGDIVKDFGLE